VWRDTNRDGCSSPEEILDCLDGNERNKEETGEVTDHLIVAELAPRTTAAFFGTSFTL
jgi:hypothetical protein